MRCPTTVDRQGGSEADAVCPEPGVVVSASGVYEPDQHHISDSDSHRGNNSHGNGEDHDYNSYEIDSYRNNVH